VERFLSDTINPVELAIPWNSVSLIAYQRRPPPGTKTREAQADFPDFLGFAAFFGTFAPAARASESPIAIACSRLVTLRPERPLLSVPALRFFIARSTSAEAFFEYFRAMIVLPMTANQFSRQVKVPGPNPRQSGARKR
jgi:hypothetical protein